MSLLDKLMINNQTRTNPPRTETKAERLEIVLNSLIESLPLPAQFLARNYITSFQLYNDEMAEKTGDVLEELRAFIIEGKIPDVSE